jgi:hypothetical protein
LVRPTRDATDVRSPDRLYRIGSLTKESAVVKSQK